MRSVQLDWRLWDAKEFWANKGGSALVTKPSDLFERQIYATFQDDHVAMSLLPFLGILARQCRSRF